MESKYAEVDKFLISKLIDDDSNLNEILANNRKNGLPTIDVSASQGKLLYLLSKMHNSKRILEIGTLGGYSTYWLAKSVGKDGRVISLEYNPKNANVATENLKASGVADLTEIMVGLATDSLQKLVDSKCEPFDFIFIDADKQNNSNYLRFALKLSKKGTVIIGDNIVRDGMIVDKSNTDSRVIGVRSFLDNLSSNNQLSSTAVETIGIKGYDGFTISIVK